MTNNIDTASYTDDSTHYVYGENTCSTTETLQKASNLLFQWFSDIHIESNAGKFHVLLSTNENVLVNLNAEKIKNSSCEKLLEIKIDSKLNLKVTLETYDKRPVLD